MRRRTALALMLVPGFLAVLAGQRALTDHRPRPAFAPRAAAPAQLADDLPASELVPMHKAVSLTQRRYAGRMLDIALMLPTPAEQASGVDIVYRLRLLTARGDVLDIRMDALSGRFIDVRGRDLTAARAPAKD